MRTSRLFPAGGALALIGLVLLVVETSRALAGDSLGTLETVLLWVGVGLVAIGGVLLVLCVNQLDGPLSDGGQPTDG